MDLAGHRQSAHLFDDVLDDLLHRNAELFGDLLCGIHGLASVVPSSLGSPAIMGGVMLAWIALPLAIANWRFKP